MAHKAQLGAKRITAAMIMCANALLSVLGSSRVMKVVVGAQNDGEQTHIVSQTTSFMAIPALDDHPTVLVIEYRRLITWSKEPVKTETGELGLP